jgi:flavin reductase (DIM6/NTAB) family NADH-FMN oxidoreductase RutF
VYIDLADTEHSWQALYKLYITFVQPRPIAFVSTIDAAGAPNLAPFSFYNMIGANPPVVIFCPSINRRGRKKDTLLNIETTREFVIATVTEPIVEQANICSTEFEYGVSEFEKSGLTPVPANKVRPFLVKESPVNIECRLRQVLSFGDKPGAAQAILGEVIAVHVDDAVLADGGLACDPAKLRTVGRMGGSLYARTTDRFSLESIRDPAELAKRGPARMT